jgi:hypothetical protein
MNSKDPKENTSIIRRAWEWWKRVARKIGDFQARILLTVFYFLFFAPFALAIRFLTDPLSIKNNDNPEWEIKSQSEGTTIEQAKRQF